MTVRGGDPIKEYTIDELARAANTTVRSIRVYHERGVFPPPQVRGRTGFYSTPHLDRLNAIGNMLARGMKLNGIKELLDAWDGGEGLFEVVGGIPPFSTAKIAAKDITKTYRDVPDGIERLLALGIVDRLDEDTYRVANPPLHRLAVRLRAAGVAPDAVLVTLEELKSDCERIANRHAELLRGRTPADAAAIAHATAALIRDSLD